MNEKLGTLGSAEKNQTNDAAEEQEQALESGQNVKADIHEKYILVLDLDETLVHFKENGKYNTSDDEKLKVRPGVSQFLMALDPYYHFVVFTAAQKPYADFVIQRIDPEGKYIKARFYRDSCR